ncbi:S-layer homology domain-containing protein [Paenibacillus sp. ACRSA]|uniref:M14 family metallopeptidase n=1 Tax=Paenibacillus sp. ACRSA TaxID=2918211 RepID=UPI001EF62121|nr:M14 family metallopeptidase [Paenibacillus sp. ACRSA]MCG7378701.1 S-layer homology domain-containing protein [Paenibacillus sp. ACRSA]
MIKKMLKKCVVVFMVSLLVIMSTAFDGAVMAASVQSKGEDTMNDLKKTQTLIMNHDVASMTEKRTFEVKLKLPAGVDAKSIGWTYDGKPLTEWKTYVDGDYTGPSFIKISNVKTNKDELTANITFDLPYGSTNLAEAHLQAQLFGSLAGTYELAAVASGQVIAQAPVKLTPYDSFIRYDDLKPEIDEVTAQAAKENDRYIETTSIGKSVEGRDIYLTIVAKDKATVDQYQNITHPAMINSPEKLQQDIKSGAFGDYAVPIWLNNIHPNESPGVDAIFNYFKSMALDKDIVYNTTLPNGKANKVTLDVNDALEHAFFLFIYTDNPDGRYHTKRWNANYFDLNRDNSYQTQPETRIVTEQIAKWSPLSFLDLHGFDRNFLIEPTTPPHDPNMEYDLVIDSMLEQAKAMGEAGIANTRYDYYHIPYEEHRKTMEDPNYVSKGTATNWDDASPGYTAVFAMHHGALGHTLEIPENNEESTKALYYSVAGATSYVMDHKESLFLNQLEIYKRGVENVDNHAVDQYLVNAKNEVIGRPRQGNENFFPEYYVLPIDKSVQKNALETYRMIEYLLRNGVQIERSTEAITVDDKTYPAGSFVINMHQALRGMANLVLYDGIDVSDFESVAGEIVQNFPDLRGFNAYSVREQNVFKNKTTTVTSVSIPSTSMPDNTTYVVIKNTNNDAIQAVNELLASGKEVTMLTSRGEGTEIGDFVVSYADLAPLANHYFLDVRAYGDIKSEGKNLKRSTVATLGEPAFVLEGLGFEVTPEPEKADVLVNLFDVDEQIKKGKPFVAYGSMGMMIVKDLIPGFTYGGPEWERYEGVFLADVKQDNVITAPYDDQEYLYTVTGSYIQSVPKNAKVLANFSTKDHFYKSGWWPGHDVAKGHIMAFTYEENNENITVFANDLTNLGHSQHQYRLLANSIYNADSTDKHGSESQAEFNDLDRVDAWAGNEIRDLAKQGIIQGTSNNQFEPLKSLTRAEFLTMLLRAFDYTNPQAQSSFTDVLSSSWSYPYISSAVELKLVDGVGGGRFEPNRAITREEMAQMAANVLKHSQHTTSADLNNSLSSFTDRSTIAPYAREAVAWLTHENIIKGYTVSTFGAKEIANRAQAAVIIHRMIPFTKE